MFLLGSFDVHFALNETEQGTVLTVEADKEWINSEERTYPVKIDPTLVVVSGRALEDIYSVYTMEAAPNDTTLGRQWLYVGAQPYSTSNDGRYRTYMHFQTMPTVPSGSEVVDAQLSLYKTAYTQRYCEKLPIGAYEVTTGLPSGYSSYRCFITDAHGDMGSTRIATVKLDTRDWQMEYNTSGLRTRRISDDKTYSYIYAGDKLMRMTVGDDILDFSYDANGTPLTMTCNGTVYYYITNLQGDVMSLERADGGSGAQYAYDAWGNIIAMMGTLAELNPLRYRGYVYDQETGFYYLQSRYYDPAVGRFISADNQLRTDNLAGVNLFAYCGNNPVNRNDPSGEAWYHWALGAAVVAAAAVATVVTCGGFAAAATAVCLVGNGVAAATTAATISAGAFIGSSIAYGMAVLSAVAASNSIEEFNEQGNWGTVAASVGGAVLGGYNGYTISNSQKPSTTPTTGKGTQNPKVQAAVQRGQAMHKQMDYGPGVIKEKTIAPGCRVIYSVFPLL